MTKITLGVSTYVQWIPTFMVGGYTQDSLCEHLAAQGVQTVTIRWGESDHPSYVPRGEPRPGEFWWGNEPVARDGNDDITSALYTSAQVAPANAPMRELLDACAAHNLRVVFQLGRWTAFTTSWNYNAYKQGRLTPGGTPSAAGVPGWLTSKRKFFSDATAKSYYKNRLDAFVNSFGDHSAIWCLDLGNEYTHVYNWDDHPWETNVFFPWVEEMSDHLWNALPGSDANKPFITISEYRAHRPDDHINNVMNYFTSVPDDKVMITWHNYNRDKTLTQIRDAIYTAQDRYPDYTIRVGENWPWYVGPTAVPDGITGINIPATAYNGAFAPDSVSPYEHERMYCFLMAATAKAADYCRWCKYVDGSGAACVSTIPRMGEILKPAQDIAETLDLGNDPERWTDNITSSGALDFVAAALGGDGRYLPFAS